MFSNKEKTSTQLALLKFNSDHSKEGPVFEQKTKLKKLGCLEVQHAGVSLPHAELSNIIMKDGEHNNALLYGPAGVGKSHILKRLKMAFEKNTASSSIANFLPVLSIESPPDASLKNFLRYLCLELDKGASLKNMTTGELIQLFQVQAKACAVKLILIDEIQHLNGRSVPKQEVKNWLKNTPKALGIPMILSGMSSAKALVSGTQLLRRFTPVRISPVPWENGAELLFSKLVENYQTRASTVGISLDCLQDAELTKRLYIATDGVFDNLKRLLECAVKNAFALGQEKPDAQSLAVAYDMLFESMGTLGREQGGAFALKSAQVDAFVSRTQAIDFDAAS